MAVSGANLTSGTDADGGSSSTTASVTPTGDSLVLLSVTSRTGITADPNQPTATGNGLTWVVVKSIVWDSDSSSRKRTTVLRALGASPSAGAITIDFGGQNQTNVIWSVDEFSGVDTGGTNGSAAVVQSVAAKDETSGGGLFTITLAAFGSVDNATYGAFGADFFTTEAAVGSGFTKLATANSSSENMAEWKATNDTSVDATFETETGMKFGGVAIEIKAAAVVASTFLPRMMLMGTG